MIWIIIISFFIGLLLWILLAPVIIFVNSDTNRYHLVLPGIFTAALVPSIDLFHIRGWIFFIPYKYVPFHLKKAKRKSKTGHSNKSRRYKKPSGNIQLIIDAVRSFRIRKLQVDLDTDDFMLNARIVPVFSFINSENIQMRVNFQGTSSLLLDMRTRLGTLLWILLRNKYKSFINQ